MEYISKEIAFLMKNCLPISFWTSCVMCHSSGSVVCMFMLGCKVTMEKSIKIVSVRHEQPDPDL